MSKWGSIVMADPRELDVVKVLLIPGARKR